MLKMSGYSIKSVFNLRIKVGIQRATSLCVTFFNYEEIRSLSPLKCAKRGGGTKNKQCTFTIQKTFVSSSICQKCQGSE